MKVTTKIAKRQTGEVGSVKSVLLLVEKRLCHKTFSVNTKTGGFLEQKTLPNPPFDRKGLT
jgi:hypothetical protein